MTLPDHIKRQSFERILRDLNKANSGRIGIEAALNTIIDAEDSDMDYPLKNNNYYKGALYNALETITDFISWRLEDMEKLVFEQ